MNGIHDLGGMEGFGPIAVSVEQNPFGTFQPWEQRMFALSQTLSIEGGRLDWFRHVIEQMVPADYLSAPYFSKWCATYCVMLADNGVFQVTEFAKPPMEHPSEPVPAQAIVAILDDDRTWCKSYQTASPVSPAFAVGQQVRTKRHMHAGHTRLPRYARDVVGEVIAHHDCHRLPDRSAEGIEQAEHLYTVRFTAQTLWGPQADPHDTVALDLWESYFVPA